jgi:hypothetical protein
MTLQVKMYFFYSFTTFLMIPFPSSLSEIKTVLENEQCSSKVQRIVVATAVLHNTAIENNEDPPPLKQREEALFNHAIDVSVDLIADTNDGK